MKFIKTIIIFSLLNSLAVFAEDDDPTEIIIETPEEEPLEEFVPEEEPVDSVPYIYPEHRIPRNPIPRNRIPRRELPRNYIPRRRLPSNDIPRREIPRNRIPRRSIERNPMPRTPIPRNRIPRRELPRNRVRDDRFDRPQSEVRGNFIITE